MDQLIIFNEVIKHLKLHNHSMHLVDKSSMVTVKSRNETY